MGICAQLRLAFASLESVILIGMLMVVDDLRSRGAIGLRFF